MITGFLDIAILQAKVEDLLLRRSQWQTTRQSARQSQGGTGRRCGGGLLVRGTSTDGGRFGSGRDLEPRPLNATLSNRGEKLQWKWQQYNCYRGRKSTSLGQAEVVGNAQRNSRPGSAGNTGLIRSRELQGDESL